MEESRWFAGVDTHADTHALCVVDEAEHVVYTGEFAATRKGFAALERALKGPDKCVRVAIEACGSRVVSSPTRNDDTATMLARGSP